MGIHHFIENIKHMMEAKGPFSIDEMANSPENLTTERWTFSNEDITEVSDGHELKLHFIAMLFLLWT